MQSNGGNMSIGDKVIMSAVIGGTAEAGTDSTKT
jgi:hypothetical protein